MNKLEVYKEHRLISKDFINKVEILENANKGVISHIILSTIWKVEDWYSPNPKIDLDSGEIEPAFFFNSLKIFFPDLGSPLYSAETDLKEIKQKWIIFLKNKSY
jgi:hypothetical protein